MCQFSFTFIILLPLFGIKHTADILKPKRAFKFASTVICIISSIAEQGNLMLIEVEKSYCCEMVRLDFKEIPQYLHILSFNHYHSLFLDPSHFLQDIVHLLMKLWSGLISIDQKYFPII